MGVGWKPVDQMTEMKEADGGAIALHQITARSPLQFCCDARPPVDLPRTNRHRILAASVPFPSTLLPIPPPTPSYSTDRNNFSHRPPPAPTQTTHHPRPTASPAPALRPRTGKARPRNA